MSNVMNMGLQSMAGSSGAMRQASKLEKHRLDKKEELEERRKGSFWGNVMSGAGAGMAFGPWGMAIGALAGAGLSIATDSGSPSGR